MPKEPGRRTTKKEAAVRQINSAIELLYEGEYECSATLAGAAEGVMPDTNSEYLFKRLSEAEPPPEFKDKKDWIRWINSTRDWLKHETPQLEDEWDLTEYAVAIMVLRAVSKFQWTYRQSTKRMEDFYKWCRERGYPAPEPQLNKPHGDTASRNGG